MNNFVNESKQMFPGQYVKFVNESTKGSNDIVVTGWEEHAVLTHLGERTCLPLSAGRDHIKF